MPPPAALEHFRVVVNDFAIAVRNADFVSLHLSASRDNLHWINRERLAQLGERTWLINTARGSLVDEAALFAALAERRLAGAALDVFAREPYAPAEGSGDLRSLANVILTPHVGSNTVDGKPPHGRARAPEHHAGRSPRVRADGSAQPRGLDLSLCPGFICRRLPSRVDVRSADRKTACPAGRRFHRRSRGRARPAARA